MTELLPVGKLPPELLASLLASIGAEDDSVVIGPGPGRDAAAVRAGNRVLVLKTDPITFASDAIGVRLVGGHTEITAGLDRPILVGQMIGEAAEADLIDPRRARPGDIVLLANGIAIEGTALIAREFPEPLIERYGEAFVERCRRFLYEPGISVVPAATVLRRALGRDLHALHDPTEGGLATGLRELGMATGLGLIVDWRAITCYPETSKICETFGLKALGLIASGALLAVVARDAEEKALTTLRSVGITARRIGGMCEDPENIGILDGCLVIPLPTFPVDEFARLLATSGQTA